VLAHRAGLGALCGDLALGRRGADGDKCISDIGGTKSIFKLLVILRRVILDVLARSA
jgi:hypothetical protein